MDSAPPTYTQSVKLRWSLLLLTALAVFVLLANARQQLPEVQTTAPLADAATTVAMVQPARQVWSRPNPPSAIRRSSLLLKEDSDTPHEEPISAETQTAIIRRGDTLSGILDDANVHSTLGALLEIKKHIAPLLNLQPGNILHLEIENSTLLSLIYEISPIERLEVTLNNKKYTANHRILPIEKQEAHAFGTIHSSFYQAALAAGLSDKTIVEMANILGWDIDFVLDVRQGDQFSVIYENEYLNGEKLRPGSILAIEFINRGKTYRAVRHTTADNRQDYFTPAGKSMRKPFIRSPIEYTRVSSHFNPRRLHPIFKTTRPHRGVDYAAPRGTPIRASGDGKITFRGSKPGYGNVVIIQHGQAYSTLYAHLSKFSGGQRRGSQVRQKQVIGYVGSTGYATGPHLHYEFRINGVHRNPLTVKLPDSSPLPTKEIPAFKQSTAPMFAKLDTLKRAYAAITPKQPE